MTKYLSFIGCGLCLVLTFACQSNKTSSTDEAMITQENILLEQHRPHFHFTPKEKWMNDPNGMVYYDGEYHLFYQYYPDSTVWGPMHWGHAVSTNLVAWEHLPIGLYPDSLGYIFSGSAVIDWNNTSGFGKDSKPPMIAIFTYHDPVGEKAGTNTFQYQGMAYSNDRGRTWTKYAGNPVLPNPGIRDFRDPKVIWDKDSNQWVMVFAAWDHVKFYGSQNLKEWQHLSDFGKEWGTHAGVWECPDIFPMTVKETGEKKWVLLQSLNPGSYNGGSGTQYFVGNFDGTTFRVDKEFAKNFGTEEAVVPDGKVFDNFENGYKKWTTKGSAFGNQPAKGRLGDQLEIKGQQGKGFVNSYLGGDNSIGQLISEDFIIEQPFINFKIGGGNDLLRTSINLVLDGKIIRNSAGNNGEQLYWKGWDVKQWIGKKAHLEIIDKHPGGWGHITVDQIVFADELAKAERAKAIWLDYGRDNYAGVTWSDIPETDGRRIFIGWMSNWDYAQVVPTEKWRSATTLPRTLLLKQTASGLRLFSKPVKELMALRKNSETIKSQKGTELNIDLSSKSKKTIVAELNLKVAIPKGNTTKLTIELANNKNEKYLVGYNAATNEYFSDRRQAGKKDFASVFADKIHVAPRLSPSDTIQLQVFFDVASAELFADGGMTTMTDIFFPNEDFNQLRILTDDGAIEILDGSVFWLD